MRTLNAHPLIMSSLYIIFVFLFVNTSSVENFIYNNDEVINRETSAVPSFIFISAEEFTDNNFTPDDGSFDKDLVKIEVCSNSFSTCTLQSCSGCDSSGNEVCCREGTESCLYWIAVESD